MFAPTEEFPTIASYVWHDTLNFCACGRPENVLVKMRDTLRALQNVSDAHRSNESCYVMGAPTPKMKALHDAEHSAAGADDGSRYLMYYVLSRARLTEHGGSVPGWPTNLGREFLTFLETTDPDDWMGES